MQYVDKPPNKKTPGDGAYQVSRAIISVLPGVGGPLSVLLDNVFSSPLQKRKEIWLKHLARVVDSLCNDIAGLTADKLSDHERFVSCALEATQLAQRIHQNEKLHTLAAATYNSALPSSPSDDISLIFIRLIGDFTPCHLRVLEFLNDVSERHSRNIHELLHSGITFPQLHGQRDFLKLILNDLRTAALIEGGNYVSGDSDTTELGKQFLAFIEGADKFKDQERQPNKANSADAKSRSAD